MAFALQLEGLRREVRVNASGLLNFYPRVDGAGRVAIDNLQTEIVVYDPSGALVAAPSYGVTTDANGDEYIAITMPALSALGENYRCTVTWAPDGGGAVQQQSFFFDVVAEPWGPSAVDESTMQSLVPSISERLAQQVRRLNSTAPAVTISTEQLASSYGYHARVTLDEWLRGRISDEAEQANGSNLLSPLDVSRKYIRPRLILDRERLHTIEVKLAIAYVFRADMQRREDQDEKAASLYAHWFGEAETSFRALGPLAYDWTDSLRATGPKVSDLGRVVRLQRRQA